MIINCKCQVVICKDIWLVKMEYVLFCFRYKASHFHQSLIYLNFCISSIT